MTDTGILPRDQHATSATNVVIDVPNEERRAWHSRDYILLYHLTTECMVVVVSWQLYYTTVRLHCPCQQINGVNQHS